MDRTQDLDPSTGPPSGPSPATAPGRAPSAGAVAGLAVALGLGAGGLLARTRGTLFPDVLDLSGPDPAAAAATRAAALLLAAALVLIGGPLARVAPGALLAGAAGGVTTALLDPLDGGLVVGVGAPWRAPLPWLALGVVAALAGRRLTAARAVRSEGPPAAGAGALTSVAALAAGATLGLEGLSRLALRLGLATHGEDALLASVLAGLVALGGLVFGRAFVRTGRAHAVAAALAAALLGLVALAIAGGVSQPLGFKALCARIGADASLAGTPAVGAFVALVVLVLPALAAGAALHLARSERTVAAALVGAAAAVAAAPTLVDAAPIATLLDRPRAGAAGLVQLGAALGGAGVLLFALLERDAARLPLAGVGLGVLAGVAGLPVSSVPVLDPWERFPVRPSAVFETGDGQFLVEPTGEGRVRVTLDQRPLGPRATELAGEAARLRASIAAAAAGASSAASSSKGSSSKGSSSTGSDAGAAAPPERVLLVGLLTVERGQVLRALGVTRADRTAGWWRSMPMVEAAAASGRVAHGLEGDVIRPAEARRRAARGAYDLVLAVGTGATGPAPPTLDLRLGDDPPPVIAWTDPERPVRHLPWPQVVVRSTDRLLRTSMAWATGPVAGDRRSSAPGADRSWWSWLRVRPDDRARLVRAETEHRLAQAPTSGGVDRGLAMHAVAQRRGSPFDSAVERVVLWGPSLEAWREAAVEDATLTPFERDVLEAAAHVLTAKRLVPELLDLVTPIEAARPGWPAMVRALAAADLEELDPEAAAARLSSLDPAERATGLLLAAALMDLDRPEAAAAALRPAAAALPSDREVGTRLADALVAAGDPEGRQVAARLLREHPGDPELFGLAQGKRGMTTLNPDPPRAHGR